MYVCFFLSYLAVLGHRIVYMASYLRNLRPLLKLLSSSKDTTWLRLTKIVISAAKLAHSESTVSFMLPGVWQVKKPELWKSLKFPGNMWTLVYFSTQAGRVESCQDAALSFSQQEGQWTECERE